jgi:hypothetical protein
MHVGTRPAIWIFTLTLMGWHGIAYARLGDTDMACKQRYGAPQKVDQAKSMMEWNVANDKRIRCYFVPKNGQLICNQIMYIGLDNDTEIKNAFAWNTEGSRWVTPLDNPRIPQKGVNEWDRADGGYAQAVEGSGPPANIILKVCSAGVR